MVRSSVDKRAFSMVESMENLMVESTVAMKGNEAAAKMAERMVEMMVLHSGVAMVSYLVEQTADKKAGEKADKTVEMMVQSTVGW